MSTAGSLRRSRRISADRAGQIVMRQRPFEDGPWSISGQPPVAAKIYVGFVGEAHYRN